ncbi:MAG: type II toxin-antitoxin system RelE/ParE family toxin [Nitrospirota bacterium]|nr:type II toxin-antitoxin system RelE/ParE family toxin [Nitrospirota bacterium]
MKVRFYKAAQIEFDSAVEYYENQLSGLGVRYRHEVLESLERIKLFPDAYSPISKRTRRCLVCKFPYGILYKATSDEIIVVAVAHLHQRPDYWVSRIRST